MRFRYLLVITVGFLMLVGGCGGSDSASEGVASLDDLAAETTATTATPSADEVAIDEEKVLEFAACMREQGIDFPDPVVDSEGNIGFDLMSLRKFADVDRETMEAAAEPCVPLLVGVNFGFDRIFDAEFQDDLVAFSACMRQNGFDMADPNFTGLADGEPLYPPLDVNDPDFEPAFDACRDTLPGIPGIARP